MSESEKKEEVFLAPSAFCAGCGTMLTTYIHYKEGRIDGIRYRHEWWAAGACVRSQVIYELYAGNQIRRVRNT